MAFAIFERWSPESALENTFDDMRASGVDGLKRHLTAKAAKNVERIESVSGNPGVALLTTAFAGNNAVGYLLGKLSECDWTIKDVMKGSESSKAVAGFDYQGKMVGTIELTLIKEDGVWKIDEMARPKFERLALS